MSMQFSKFVTRIDEGTAQELLGLKLVAHLSRYDRGYTTAANLQRLLAETVGAFKLLKNPKTRKILLYLLKPKEINELKDKLNIEVPAGGEVYSRVTGAAYNQRNLALLMSFFELEMADIEERVAVPASRSVIADYALFEHQRTALSEIVKLLSGRRRRAVLHMPTGSGKTRTAMNLIVDHLRSNETGLCIWFATSEELCEQAVEEFERAWRHLGNREMGVYRFWGDYEVDISGVRSGLLVAGLPKCWARYDKTTKFINNLARNCTLIVVDEAHSSVADTYELVIAGIMSQRSEIALVGLTATPGRTWDNVNEDKKLADFFYRQKVTLHVANYSNPLEYLVQNEYLAETKFNELFYKGGVSLSEADLARVEEASEIPIAILKRLGEDEQRNLVIISKVEELLIKHKRVLLFATSVEHSDLIASILTARGKWARSITTRTEPVSRRQFIADYKTVDDTSKVLCNYGVLTTGFDAPQTSVAVITRPTKSLVLYSQMIGRAMRGPKANGNKKAEIYTVIDRNLPGFRNIVESFNNWEDVWT